MLHHDYSIEENFGTEKELRNLNLSYQNFLAHDVTFQSVISGNHSFDVVLNFEQPKNDGNSKNFVVFGYVDGEEESMNIYQYIGIDPVLVYRSKDATSNLVEYQTDVSAGDTLYVFSSIPYQTEEAETGYALGWKTQYAYTAKKNNETITLPKDGKYWICNISTGVYELIDEV